jgi:hypothetical protein
MDFVTVGDKNLKLFISKRGESVDFEATYLRFLTFDSSG